MNKEPDLYMKIWIAANTKAKEYGYTHKGCGADVWNRLWLESKNELMQESRRRKDER